MNIHYTRKSKRWLHKHNVDTVILTDTIQLLCKREGACKADMTINIRPNAVHSDFVYWFNRMNIAVESSANKPRHYKLRKVLRNLLHELRHFIQYRIHKKPFTFSYTYRDLQLVSDRYWNDPDEIDARNYERKYLKFIYKRLV